MSFGHRVNDIRVRREVGNSPIKRLIGQESNQNYSDDEYEGPIFKVAIGDEVKHDPDDRFDKRGIPMRPDRVVGLAQTRRFQNDVALSSPELTHCPVSGADSMLYPFLVLEAKREDGAPGFRAVERQTAFPLRRFLKLQDALQRACSKNLEPLVWFFAYQGELWRLYAGTLVNANLVCTACKLPREYLLSNQENETDRNYAACIRSLAWYNRIAGWCVTTFANRRLYLDLGQGHLSPPDSMLLAWQRH